MLDRHCCGKRYDLRVDGNSPKRRTGESRDQVGAIAEKKQSGGSCLVSGVAHRVSQKAHFQLSLSKNPIVATSDRDPLPVQLFQKRENVLTAGTEKLSYFGDVDFTARF